MITKASTFSCPEAILAVIEVLRKEARHVCRLFTSAKNALPQRGSLDAHASSHTKTSDTAWNGSLGQSSRSRFELTYSKLEDLADPGANPVAMWPIKAQTRSKAPANIERHK